MGGGVGAPDPGAAPGYDGAALPELEHALDQVYCLQAASTLQYLRVVAALDRQEVWKDDGQSAMSGWLALRHNLSRATARQVVRCASVIDQLPAVAEAFGTGRLSFDQLDALCQLATPETEQAWLEEAEHLDAEMLRRCIRRRWIAAESAKEIRERRAVTFRPDAQAGVTRISGVLEASDAAEVQVALDRLATQHAEPDPASGRFPAVCQQRADALVLLASLGLGADGDVDRATVVVHGDVGLLTDEDAGGHATLADHMPIAADAFRRVACDGRIEWAVDGPDGTTLGVGRAERTWPAWLARRIRHRDGEVCRFPGCTAPIHQIHHIVTWSAGNGGTDDTNGIGLCWSHHHDVHEGGWTIEGNPNGTVSFTGPGGRSFRSGCPGLAAHTLDWLSSLDVAAPPADPPAAPP